MFAQPPDSSELQADRQPRFIDLSRVDRPAVFPGSRSLGVPCSKRPSIGICHDVGATLPMEARNETRGKSTTMVGRVGAVKRGRLGQCPVECDPLKRLSECHPAAVPL